MLQDPQFQLCLWFYRVARVDSCECKVPWSLQSWELFTHLSPKPHESWQTGLWELLGCPKCYSSLFFKKSEFWTWKDEGKAKGVGADVGGRECHPQKNLKTGADLGHPQCQLSRSSFADLEPDRSTEEAKCHCGLQTLLSWRTGTLIQQWLLQAQERMGERGGKVLQRRIYDGETEPALEEVSLCGDLESRFRHGAVCTQFPAPPTY